jgi:hypothetical protein
MKRLYERKHADPQGSIVATVTEGAERYEVTFRCCHDDYRPDVTVAVSNGEPSGYQSLGEAQRDADRKVQILGHTCSALCEPWPPAVTH